MLDTIVSFVDELRREFRIVDAVDIVLVSLFLYAALLWFQQTASRGVLIGVALMALVYFLARGLDMYLTSLAFHTSFAVLLFTLVVVFQEDLRRLLERVATLRSPQLKGQQDLAPELDSLVESVFSMANSRTGALIVLKGKEPLARHVNGGVQLNGHVSKPLLLSIFDSHTPGHDGAVLIEHDQITHFAAHLPISQNTNQIAGRGTRHSAALGLSERSDALTIVVSEERGVVGVSAAGKLEAVPTASDLRQRLEEFVESRFPAATQSMLKHLILHDLRLKVLAITVAILAWFALAYDPNTVQRTFVIPIEYRNLDKQLGLDVTAPTEGRVTLSGSERDFRFLHPASLKISLDLIEIGSGVHEIPLSARNVRLPANLFPYRIEPKVIRLHVRHQAAPQEDGKSNGAP